MAVYKRFERKNYTPTFELDSSAVLTVPQQLKKNQPSDKNIHIS